MIATPWPAPAKLNLFLHVTGRRADGFHELQTLYQLIDVGDELAIRPRADGLIRRSGAEIGALPAGDLIVRAAQALRAAAAAPALGADIELTKRIPIGSGLGGGSSDAASTLLALNELWRLGFSRERLAEVGLGLGTDVPFFVHGSTALATGIGERLTAVEVPLAYFAVVFPGAPVRSAEAFQAPELTRNSEIITIPGFLSPGWPTRPLAGRNDLQPVVATRHPPVRAALEWLGRRAEARLTGSGGAVFAAFSARSAAQAALAGLPAGWTGFVATGLSRSPLEARVQAEREAGRPPR